MIDVHSHFIPAQMLAWLRENSDAVAATWEQRVPNKEPFLTVNQKWSFELKQEFYDANKFLAAQAEAGVEHSLVSPVPQLFLYDLPPDLTATAAEVYNNALASWVREHPNRLSGLATLPLNDPEVAARALQRAMQQGLKGAIIGPGTDGQLLSSARFAPIWQAAEAQRAILFIHPLLNEDPRIQQKMMPNLIGVPWETTVCALDLILNGILDRYPHVKILLAHGGGFLPYQVGRLNQGYQSWPVVKNALQAAPQDYLQRFWYDNVLWHAESLRLLQNVVGTSRVLPGSDFPFDLKTWPPTEAEIQASREFLGSFSL
ncbi:MAG: amidohydrolase [Alicyclobacillus sp. RIFOXYA1_FULL_53_8]|nr:MAG: amidohydrolase [Alicyclobacillus sp. RIFOXYA1_FULL_53_8]